jgi:hypothetical protein
MLGRKRVGGKGMNGMLGGGKMRKAGREWNLELAGLASARMAVAEQERHRAARNLKR